MSVRSSVPRLSLKSVNSVRRTACRGESFMKGMVAHTRHTRGARETHARPAALRGCEALVIVIRVYGIIA